MSNEEAKRKRLGGRGQKDEAKRKRPRRGQISENSKFYHIKDSDVLKSRSFALHIYGF